MIVVKREFVDLDPNDASLQYRNDRDEAAEKLLGEYTAIRDDMEANGQRSPIMVDRIVDEDFNVRVTYVTDGFRRWIAAKSDELNLPTINAIVTTWVDNKNAIQIKPTTLADVNPANLTLNPGFEHICDELGAITGDSDALTAQKNPPAFPEQAAWLEQTPGASADNYAAASAAYASYAAAWATIDGYIETNGQPENTILTVREMFKNAAGDFFFSTPLVHSREDSLAVVSCRERGITIAEVSVRTIDRTGTQPGR